jgi:NTP pyrophosphatase (non-canonical NTP hydrolase)
MRLVQMNETTAKALRERMEHARAKHPEGPSMAALEAELCEARDALRQANPLLLNDSVMGGKLDITDELRRRQRHYKDELLDVATVALRLYEGE